MKQNMVIGCITDYEYKDIEPWVVSLEQSGFQGTKALIIQNGSKALIDKLRDKNFKMFGFNIDSDGNFTYPRKTNASIVVERFAHLWYFLNQLDDVDLVITTDVKDVIFQKNPSIIFDYFNQDYSFIVSTEEIQYKNEPWSRNNMQLAFGQAIYETMKEQDIICAGSIFGKRKALADLALQVFLMCRNLPGIIPGGGGPDQSALNILLRSEVYADVTIINDTLTLHAGTSLPAIQAGSGAIGEEYIRSNKERKAEIVGCKTRVTMPEMDTDEYIKWGGSNIVQNERKYTMVHQYDRVPVWKDVINRKYRE